MNNIAQVLNEVVEERTRQEVKFGPQDHPCLDKHVIEHEAGPFYMTQHYGIPSEARAKANLEKADANGRLTFAHILIEEVSEAVSEFDVYKRRQEVLQIAAVAVAWVEKIDRDIEKMNQLKIK